MNKCRSAVLCLLGMLFCFSACGKRPGPGFEPVRNTVCGFQLRHEKLTARGTVAVKGPGCYELSFSSPDPLRYISFETEADAVSVYYGGHTDTASLQDMPDVSVFKLMILAMDDVIFGENDFIRGDEDTVLTRIELLSQNVTASFLTDGKLDRLDFAPLHFSVLFEPY